MTKLIYMTTINLFLEILMLIIFLIKYRKTEDITIKILFPILGAIVGTQISTVIKLF